MPGLSDALRELVDRMRYGPAQVVNVDPPAPRLKPMEALAFSPEQREYSRENGGLWDSTPPGYDDSPEAGRRDQILRVAAGGGDLTPFLTQPAPDARPPAQKMAGAVRPPDESWRGRSNEENIRAVNQQLAAQRVNAGPSAGLSDDELDAKVQAQLGPKDRWKMPAPTPEGMALYNDLLAAAKKASAPGPATVNATVGPIVIEKRVPAAPSMKAIRQADASPEQKTQTAPGGGAGGAGPAKAALQMALAQIPSPDVRALLAKRMKLATDGDTELRAAQAKEERLGALAGLQRQLGQAAATMGGDRYDDTGAAGAERAAGAGTRAVMAQRQQQDQHAQRAMDILAEVERERSNRAGEGLKERDLGLEERRLGETERHQREGEKIDWYQARTARDKVHKEGAAYDKEVQKLAKEMGGEVALGAQKLKELDVALRAQGIQGIDDLATKKELSGVGPVTNLATKLSGNALINQKGADLRNSALGLAATIKYLRTGKTATKQEAEEIAQEFGMAPGSSEVDFRQGVQRMRDEFVARARQKGAGFTPGAVSTFEQRGGTTANTLGQIGKKPITRTVNGETRTWNGSVWVK